MGDTKHDSWRVGKLARSQFGLILFVPNGPSDHLPICSDALSLDACRSKLSRAANRPGFVDRNQIRGVSGDNLGVRQALKVCVLSSGTHESAQTIVFVVSESPWR